MPLPDSASAVVLAGSELILCDVISPRIHSRLGKTQTDLERCAAPRPPTNHPGGPEPAPSNKRAHDPMAASAGPNRPRTMRPLHNSTVTSANPKLTPSNMPASVENLFPLSSAATPCSTNRNLQQENHSNFTVASHTPPTPWHQGGTMTSGATSPHLRRDLPPHCRFQIRTDPSW